MRVNVAVVAAILLAVACDRGPVDPAEESGWRSTPADAAREAAPSGWAGTQLLGTGRQEALEFVRRTPEGGLLLAGTSYDDPASPPQVARPPVSFLAWFSADGAFERVQELPAGTSPLEVDATGAVLAVAFANDTYRLLKLDTTGEPLWSTELSSGGVRSIVAAPGGDVLVAGDGPWLARFDGGGRLLWEMRLYWYSGGSLSAIALGPDGDVHAVGGADYPFVARFAPDGALRWLTPLQVRSAPSAIAVDGLANTYFAGSAWWAVPGFGYSGASDAYVGAVSPDGAVRWYGALATGGFDSGEAVAAHPGGGVVFAGGTGSAPWGGVEGESFLARYTEDGARAWIARLDLPGDDFAASLSVDAAGSTVLAGTAGRSADGNAPQHADAYLARIDAAGDVQ